MRRAALAGLAGAHAPRPVAVPLLDRSLQPHLDQMQHMPVDDAPGHRFEEVRMRDRVEIFRQVGVNHVGVAPANQPVRFLDRIDRAATRAIAIGVVLEVRLEDRLQHDLDGSLNHPIPNRRDSQGTFAAPRLRDRRPPHRIGPIRLRHEVLAQARQPRLHAKRLNLLEGRPVHPRCARIGAGQRIGVPKVVIAADLVVEDVEAESGLRLRLTIELSLKVPDLFGRFEAHRQSPPPRRLRKRSEARALSSAGITRPHRSYDPVRLPHGPLPNTQRRSRDLRPRGSPPITRITLPPCHAHYPDGSNGCICRLLPRPPGLPRCSGGSASISSLSRPAQALLTLRPAGSLNRPRRPSSRGSGPASHPARPLVSYQINRQLSGWNLPPLQNARNKHRTQSWLWQDNVCLFESHAPLYPSRVRIWSDW